MPNHPFTDASNWLKLKTGLTQLAKTEVLARFEQVSVEVKQDGSLLTEADTQMQIKTQAFLEKNWPEFAFLGEESSLASQENAMLSEQV
ncbi:hypothetical protein MNBD_GAMMA04-1847, partial [hydrothermal vent metagenome]